MNTLGRPTRAARTTRNPRRFEVANATGTESSGMAQVDTGQVKSDVLPNLTGETRGCLARCQSNDEARPVVGC
jgi:hypothetical protein